MRTHMTRTFTLTTLTAALLALPLAAAAGPRDEQRTRDARIKVAAQVQIDISRELREALRDVTEGIGDMVTDITRDLGRDLGRELRHLPNLSAIARLGDLGLEHLGEMAAYGWDQDRNWRASLDDRQTKTIAIGATGTLELENFSGDITVTASSGKDVSVDIIRSSHGRTEADARAGLDRVRPEVEIVGSRATVRASYMDRPTAYSVSTDFVVKAPAGTRIVVNSLRADVKVTGIKGEISITTASGDVVLTDVGTIREAKTGSGDVVIKGSTSDDVLDAGTLSGDILLTDVKARRITANTVQGSVEARDVVCDSASLSTIAGDVIYAGTLSRGGRYEFTSNTGDVSFTPTGSTGYAVQATSFTGEIVSAVALQSETGRSLAGTRGPRRRAATAKVGDGSATVTLQTFSGDISIGKKR
ncbi:MAG: hypothetical protein EPO35_05610 [Acidobacteria bacterium]|nr:MAG: hypothetical protein EPO35_05610 [Acidobacteriota bacterium]